MLIQLNIRMSLHDHPSYQGDVKLMAELTENLLVVLRSCVGGLQLPVDLVLACLIVESQTVLTYLSSPNMNTPFTLSFPTVMAFHVPSSVSLNASSHNTMMPLEGIP